MPEAESSPLRIFPAQSTESPGPESSPEVSQGVLSSPLRRLVFTTLDATPSFITIIQPEPTIPPLTDTPTRITPSSLIPITPIGTPGIPQPSFFPPSQTPPSNMLIIIVSFAGAIGLITTLCISFACYRSMKRRRQQNISDQASSEPEAGRNASTQQENGQQGSNSLEVNEQGVSPFRSYSNHSTQRATGGQHTGAALGTSSGSAMHAGTTGRA
ncbi:hypothetical protein Daesc_005542 [Daldinia eschscholtzii]|uniref:Uncharacterized protein n=1 Tax=Daldinia eschscholtzii TaxID=292717 RepID=A0AAX6MM32_9PEZI